MAAFLRRLSTNIGTIWMVSCFIALTSIIVHRAITVYALPLEFIAAAVSVCVVLTTGCLVGFLRMVRPDIFRRAAPSTRPDPWPQDWQHPTGQRRQWLSIMATRTTAIPERGRTHMSRWGWFWGYAGVAFVMITALFWIPENRLFERSVTQFCLFLLQLPCYGVWLGRLIKAVQRHTKCAILDEIVRTKPPDRA